MITVFVLPYNKDHATHIKMDIAFWGLLAIFFCFDESSMFHSLKSPDLFQASQIIRSVVLLMPMLYFVCIPAYLILPKIMRKVRMVVNRMRAWRRQGYTGIDESDDPEPHRLSNPEQYTNDNLLPLINPCRQDGTKSRGRHILD